MGFKTWQTLHWKIDKPGLLTENSEQTADSHLWLSGVSGAWHVVGISNYFCGSALLAWRVQSRCHHLSMSNVPRRGQPEVLVRWHLGAGAAPWSGRDRRVWPAVKGVESGHRRGGGGGASAGRRLPKDNWGPGVRWVHRRLHCREQFFWRALESRMRAHQCRRNIALNKYYITISSRRYYQFEEIPKGALNIIFLGFQWKVNG